jgi:hypothetical protein
MERRILELALEALLTRRTELEEEIAELSKAVGGKTRVPIRPKAEAAAEPRGRGSRTPSERKAQSDRMKAYLAKRRRSAGKATRATKAAGARPKASEASKAQSERMKAYWAKRKKAETKPEASKAPAPNPEAAGESKAADARKAQSARMKEYWAKRKAAGEKKAR